MGILAAGVTSTVLALAGCTLQNQNAPDVTGPSGFGLSLTMVATPVVLPRDGSSQTTIVVTARDSAGAAMPNVRIVPSVLPTGTAVAEVNPVTASDGTATFVVTAVDLATVAPDNQIKVWFAPVGTDALNTRAQAVAVGLLGPSNATYPSPDFTVSPEAPKANATVVFDASPTTDEGVVCETCTFAWSIEGTTQEGRVAIYTFGAEGAYPITLTVTDATGASRSITRAVEIAAPATTAP